MKEIPPPAEKLTLVEPTLELESAFLEMAQECREHGEPGFNDALRNFKSYVRLRQAHALGKELPAGRVPGTSYWLVRNDKDIVATASLRHELNEHLEKEGGHIGYNVRPSERRKGYGTRLLAMVLDKARGRGMTRVLVTCDTDNIASAKIIRANGGKLETEVISDFTGKVKSRYWIDL